MNVSNVPFCVRALVVVDPSNDADARATLPESEESVTTSLSPLAMVTSLVCNAPLSWMFPCVCAKLVTSLLVWVWPERDASSCDPAEGELPLVQFSVFTLMPLALFVSRLNRRPLLYVPAQ